MTSPTRHSGCDKRHADAPSDAPPRSKNPQTGDGEEIENFSNSNSRVVSKTRSSASTRSFTTSTKQMATKSSSNTGRNCSQTASAALGAHIVSIDYRFVHSRAFTLVSDLKSGPVQSVCQKKADRDQDQSRTAYQFGGLDRTAVHNRTAVLMQSGTGLD
jgi:hypothetical protein